ncbi:MAG: UDP-N-acetylmuramate--L-alanine ligase [Firmicutes bacterium]|nr:UDP-N-acetylmuramate--L-alanine ligase [Bacillota bacterium]
MQERTKVHMIGIGGSGMSPMAKVLLEKGWEVSGSDLRSSTTTENLSRLGARIHTGHDTSNLGNVDLVVISSAISPDNPEVVAAREAGIKVIHRSEMLACLLNNSRGIAVSGAHGKTTITSMIALILEKAGVDPTVLIGGELSDIGGGARSGHGDYLVAEADESDGSFLRYRPEIAVVSNIEADHLENYNGQFSQVVASFERFLANIKPGGCAVLGLDDPIVAELATKCQAQVIGYGFQKGEYRASDVEVGERGVSFILSVNGAEKGRFELKVPGRHNVSNALAAIAVARQVGVDLEDIREALRNFHGAKRRFQFIGDVNDILVVDDYAHHPTEIKATIRAAKEGWQRRVFAVFQPHRYTRTFFLFDEFAKAFNLADETIIANIYSPPPDKPIPGVTAAKLAERVREESGRPVHQYDDHEEIVQYLASHVRPGDMVITMGAGDIWMVAHRLTEVLKNSLSDAVW